MPSLQQQLNLIINKIQKSVNDSLDKEMSKYVKQEIMSSVSDTVYGAGIPEYYDRRAGNAYGGMGNAYGTGSLGDPLEMEHSVSNGTLMVMDTALPSEPESLNMDLTSAIVHGYWDKDEWWNMPRDFITATKRNIKETGGHIDVMRWALEKRLGKGNVSK